MNFWAIYGAEIGAKYTLPNLTIEPIFKTHLDLVEALKDKETIPATAIVQWHDNCKEEFKDLLAVLSFMDQSPVEIWGPLTADSFGEAIDQSSGKAHAGSVISNGRLITSDAFASGMRAKVLKLALTTLSDNNDRANPEFRRLFHGCVFGLDKGFSRYIEVQYFMYFSGLEALARKVENDVDSPAPTVISKFLKRYGFPLKVQDDNELHMGCLTYTRLRNSLFHNGKLQAKYNYSNSSLPEKTLFLSEYSPMFECLVQLVILRYIGFDWPGANWDTWRNLNIF